MPAKRILMIVGDFVEDYEVMVPYQMLLLAGHFVDVVSPDKSAGDFVATAIHDFEGHQTYTEKRGHNFLLNKSFDAVDVEDYDGLILPGGRSPEYLRLDARVLTIARAINEAKKPLGAICHGPQILVAADILKGVSCCPYPSVNPEILQSGGTLELFNETYSNACVSGHIVTAPAWPAHPAFIKAFLDLLGTTIEP